MKYSIGHTLSCNIFYQVIFLTIYTALPFDLTVAASQSVFVLFFSELIEVLLVSTIYDVENKLFIVSQVLVIINISIEDKYFKRNIRNAPII